MYHNGRSGRAVANKQGNANENGIEINNKDNNNNNVQQRRTDLKASSSDFDLNEVISKGSFGTVYLALLKVMFLLPL